jgi:hypothetical protein
VRKLGVKKSLILTNVSRSLIQDDLPRARARACGLRAITSFLSIAH